MISVAVGVFVSGCSTQPTEATTSSAQALTAPNGNGLNGNGLNGNGLNGNGLNGNGLNGNGLNGPDLGSDLQWVSLASGELEGQALEGVSLQGSELVGTLAGQTIAALGLVGAQFTGQSDNGTALTLRVDDVTQEAAPNDDTFDYAVSFWDPNTSTWAPLCRDADGNAVGAYALQGYWSYAFGTPGGGAKIDDPSKFVFACKGLASLGKCVGWGYAPWRTQNGVSLSGHHQACVRMVRADFCGDGTSYTQNGNEIDLYDGLSVQVDTEAWVKEAEWDADGARCFYAENRSATLDPVPSIPCYDAAKEDGCGDTAHFQTGTLLIDEIPAY
jgi:hypothetical protein